MLARISPTIPLTRHRKYNLQLFKYYGKLYKKYDKTEPPKTIQLLLLHDLLKRNYSGKIPKPDNADNLKGTLENNHINPENKIIAENNKSTAITKISGSMESKIHDILKKTKLKYFKTKDLILKYASAIKKQYNKSVKAIKEANEKFDQQEKEATRLNYNTDLKTHSKIQNLPSELEKKRMQWARKLSFYMDSLQETIFTATRALNDVTGYSSIQKLRNSIEVMEKELEDQKQLGKEAKKKYEHALLIRTQSQSELNELLQRKNSWNAEDLNRFTTLFKEDSKNQQKEEDCAKTLKEAELKEESLGNELYKAILTRYHEEQIWSDKIRRTSTWGTFMLMSVNILLFVVVQLLLEPWKRRRLVRSFEDKVKVALEENKTEQDVRFDKLLGLLDDRPEDKALIEKALLSKSETEFDNLKGKLNQDLNASSDSAGGEDLLNKKPVEEDKDDTKEDNGNEVTNDDVIISMNNSNSIGLESPILKFMIKLIIKLDNLIINNFYISQVSKEVKSHVLYMWRIIESKFYDIFSLMATKKDS
ncbi:uncharacterized protein SCODWIG_01396 [Saccharomycodes ludwigii]|uniref:Sensitive to high expression protein 9, mitochondrial n=2 Tax=Saccharomycodes ludwigii TaxID=36035 RepID=A0A376B4L9_9ASCO|nr:uncharacterized protein SCODWIG_01396 [Saccharomycodes ludwigii]